jgi:hypothetical protein
VVASEVAAKVVVAKEVKKAEAAKEVVANKAVVKDMVLKEAVAEVAAEAEEKAPSPQDSCNAVVEKARARVDILTTERKSFVYLPNIPIVI